MFRSIITKALPVMSTVAAVLYTRERKGWAWAAVAGVGAHAATDWLTNLVTNALEAGQMLPDKPVELTDDQVVVPEISGPVAVPGPSSNPIDGSPSVGKLSTVKNFDNVIKLPTPMGEP